MEKVFSRPAALSDVATHYCPGCTHGIIHRLVAEVLDEMGLTGNTVGVCPVGCSVMAYNYFECDICLLYTSKSSYRLAEQQGSSCFLKALWLLALLK